jgi:cytochrome c oxidase subunit 2
MKMKLMGWAIALTAIGLTPASLAAQTPPAAAPQAAATPVAAAPAPAGTPAATTVSTVTDPKAVAPAAIAPSIKYAAPSRGIGVPDGRKGIQEQVTDVGRGAAAFHNGPLLIMCVAISIFVLILLAYTMIKFRRGAHPIPSRTTHNTLIEVIWTVVPVLILVAIAVPSIRLISAQYSPPPADLTIKVIGNQWYWTYQYPDNGGFEIVSNMLKEKGDAAAGVRVRTDADGPPMLAADERMVIPAGKTVKFMVTSADVIHAFWVPAFWNKIDAIPGRLNETWAKVDRPGVYFGQCTELCGPRHAYMPIVVEVVPEATFNAWLASKGGTPKGVKPNLEAIPANAPAAGAAPAPVATAGSPEADRGAIEQPVLNQAQRVDN